MGMVGMVGGICLQKRRKAKEKRKEDRRNGAFYLVSIPTCYSFTSSFFTRLTHSINITRPSIEYQKIKARKKT